MTDFERLRAMLEPKLGGWLSAAQIDDLVRYQLVQGVLVPPCKVGDTVYGIRRKLCYFGVRKNSHECFDCPYIDADFVNIKEFSKFCQNEYEVYECKIPTVSWLFANVLEPKTKRFFLTREEAEQALKEREKE